MSSPFWNYYIRNVTKDQELKDAILAQHKEVYTRRTEVNSNSNSNSNQQYKKMASGTVVRYARDIGVGLKHIPIEGRSMKDSMRNISWTMERLGVDAK